MKPQQLRPAPARSASQRLRAVRGTAKAMRAAPPPPLRPGRTLSDAAFDLIRADLIAGAFHPAKKLRIDDLRGRYGLGATPVREALNRLVMEGFIIAVGQRGFHAAPLSGADLQDVTRMRILLETEALRESIARGDDHWESEVVGAYHGLSKVEIQRKRDFGRWEERNNAFHDALVSRCTSPWLLRFRKTLYDQHKRYRWIAVHQHGLKRDVEAEHAEIQEMALRRDAEAASAATARHIRLTAEAAGAVLRATEEGEA